MCVGFILSVLRIINDLLFFGGCLVYLNIVKVSKLEDLGVETAILSFDHQKSSLEVYELSSKGATGFLDAADTVNNFALHFKGIAYENPQKWTQAHNSANIHNTVL